MIENVLTNYNIKFKPSQIDNDQISKKKLYYKIYNNKIQEPLHKFWFSVPNLKYSNNYSDFKTIKFLMNNKNENISNLIDFIKDLSNCMLDKFKPIFPNMTIDYPWKESEQYPHLFTFFTNDNSLIIDSEGNESTYDILNLNETYSIIFEISSLKILPVVLEENESYIMKINLVLILIRQDVKKDLKKYLFTKPIINNCHRYNYSESQNETHFDFDSNNNKKKLPFLQSINENINLLSLKNTSNIINEKSKISDNDKQNTNKLIVNTEELMKAMNKLKKVGGKKNEDSNNDLLNEHKNFDNVSQINSEYLEKKNSLKKVETRESSLINILQKKNKKKKNKLSVDQEKENEIEKELELIFK